MPKGRKAIEADAGKRIRMRPVRWELCRYAAKAKITLSTVASFELPVASQQPIDRCQVLLVLPHLPNVMDVPMRQAEA